jgi:hypothetical protein
LFFFSDQEDHLEGPIFSEAFEDFFPNFLQYFGDIAICFCEPLVMAALKKRGV